MFTIYLRLYINYLVKNRKITNAIKSLPCALLFFLYIISILLIFYTGDRLLANDNNTLLICLRRATVEIM